MGDNAMLVVIGVILVFPLIFYFLKVWLFATGTPGSTFHRVQRIVEMDGHLSFDERLADKLRALEKEEVEGGETHSPPAGIRPPSATPPAPKGFGRRGL